MPDTLPPSYKFGVGQPVPRTEDPRLITGGGRYTDDVHRPGEAHAVIVRSSVAHGYLRGIDSEQARGMAGVLAVYSGADLAAAGLGDLPSASGVANRDGTLIASPAQKILARDKVRYVGEPIAVVVAETLAQARAAAEAVLPDIEPLPAVTDMAAAAKPGAPQIWDEVPGNIVFDYLGGDLAAVEKAMASAAHVTRLRLHNNRVVVAPMEPRAAVAEYDSARQHWTLWCESQGVSHYQIFLAEQVFHVKPSQVRIITGDVGGSFGMKAPDYPEDVSVMFAARDLGRPVRWCDDRSASFLSDHHGRASLVDAAMALDADGKITAVRFDGLGDVGAQALGGGVFIPTLSFLRNMVSVYTVPAVAVTTKCVITNATPIAAYRGAGRPEANYMMERLIDQAARDTGRDRLELRRRNFIPANAFPYKTPSGLTYDCGDFHGVLDKALEVSEWAGFAARKAAAKGRGKLRGIGLASYLEVAAGGGKELGEIEFAENGDLIIRAGTQDNGQGHAVSFAQVVADQLGVDPARIRYRQGDTDEIRDGGGTGGSRSMVAAGGAFIEASREVVEKGRKAAGHMLEAAADDIEFKDGAFRIVGTDRAIGLMDLAAQLRQARDLPADVPQSLDVSLIHTPGPNTFPNGAHVAEVEVDPETGVTELVAYAVVDDFGTSVNPMLVEGQVYGGVVQGIGQALTEHVVYSEDGQPLTGSFMDYALPRADLIPNFVFAEHPVPTKTNALGAKGCGEAGCSGSLPAVMNALVDALAEAGVAHINMPATPARVWQAIEAARRGEPSEDAATGFDTSPYAGGKAPQAAAGDAGEEPER
ncbi:MAG: xanthine dehydrogenase family protein molybdopterin-binding subunit [Alphaproteobacteria bacterium]